MSTIDPGRNAPIKPPYAGDEHAQRIRAALDRLKSSGRAPTATEETNR